MIGLLLQNNQGYSSPCSPFPSSNKNCSNYSGYGHYKYKSCSFLHSEISQANGLGILWTAHVLKTEYQR